VNNLQANALTVTPPGHTDNVRDTNSRSTFHLFRSTPDVTGSSSREPLGLQEHHHHTTTVLWPFFWDHPGEPVPEENFWTLWCKGRLTEADTLTIQLRATPSGLTSAHLHHPPIFYYGPDALPAAQPTVSKH